jgi:hypothetical protein
VKTVGSGREQHEHFGYNPFRFHTFIWWGRAHRDAIHPRYGPTQFKDLGLLRQAEVELTRIGALRGLPQFGPLRTELLSLPTPSAQVS